MNCRNCKVSVEYVGKENFGGGKIAKKCEYDKCRLSDIIDN